MFNLVPFASLAQAFVFHCKPPDSPTLSLAQSAFAFVLLAVMHSPRALKISFQAEHAQPPVSSATLINVNGRK